jgi:hypothetical protein
MRMNTLPGREIISNLVASLTYPDFRYLWWSGVWANAAAWALIVARGVLSYEISGSSIDVAWTTFAAFLPLLFVPPVIGILSDRLNRRTILAWTFSINILQCFVLAVVVTLGDIQMWHLVPLALLNGVARAAQITPTQALLPNLVPPQQLGNAVAMNQVTYQGTRLLGPALIAPILVQMGAGAVFYLCAAFYAVGLYYVLRIRTDSTGVIDQDRSLFHNFTAGLVYTYRHPLLFPLTLLVTVHCALTMSFEAMFPALSSLHYPSAAMGVSLLMTAVGLGASIAVIALALVRDEKVVNGPVTLALGIGSGLASMAVAFAPGPVIGFAATTVLGVTSIGFMTIITIVYQRVAPDALRGRIFSVFLFHAGGVMAFGNLGNGILTDLYSAAGVFFFAGLVFVAVMMISLAIPTLRHLYTFGFAAIPPDAE